MAPLSLVTVLKHIPLITLFSGLSSAQSTTAATPAAACKAIEGAATTKLVFYAADTLYKNETANYWNNALRAYKPACVVLPQTAEEVSIAVKTLDTFPGVKFAVKSGGHDPNAGHASTDGGVLIATSRLKGTKNDPAKGVAYVKPGGVWNDVIEPLVKEGVAVVGGRLGVVGVGGYLAQGGVSFLSAQYGLGADNIVEYELVQPNGTIAKINRQNNPGLMTALKGSGNQFGIITQYTLKTHKIGQVWGGTRIYSAADREKVFAALHQFIQNGDPKAAVIVTHETVIQQSLALLIFFFYDGPEPPKGAFGSFLDIKPLIDQTKVQSYAELLKANGNGAGADTFSSRTSFRSITLPHIPSGPGFYEQLQKTFDATVRKEGLSALGAVFSVAYQPFPKTIGKQSAANGGNAMGLGANDKDRFVLEINGVWGNANTDEIVYKVSRDFVTEATKLTQTMVKGNATAQAETYLPFFMNDASTEQDVFGSYKDVAKFSALQKQMDPKGMFLSRAGGFSYATVGKGALPPTRG